MSLIKCIIKWLYSLVSQIFSKIMMPISTNLFPLLLLLCTIVPTFQYDCPNRDDPNSARSLGFPCQVRKCPTPETYWSECVTMNFWKTHPTAEEAGCKGKIYDVSVICGFDWFSDKMQYRCCK